jgi:hypothetical protein
MIAETIKAAVPQATVFRYHEQGCIANTLQLANFSRELWSAGS